MTYEDRTVENKKARSTTRPEFCYICVQAEGGIRS